MASKNKLGNYPTRLSVIAGAFDRVKYDWLIQFSPALYRPQYYRKLSERVNSEAF